MVVFYSMTKMEFYLPYKMYEMNNQPKVVSCRITTQPETYFDPLPKVYVTLDNNTEECIFDYYPDEISFTPDEFIGLTIKECRHLKFVKDKNYLKS